MLAREHFEPHCRFATEYPCLLHRNGLVGTERCPFKTCSEADVSFQDHARALACTQRLSNYILVQVTFCSDKIAQVSVSCRLVDFQTVARRGRPIMVKAEEGRGCSHGGTGIWASRNDVGVFLCASDKITGNPHI